MENLEIIDNVKNKENKEKKDTNNFSSVDKKIKSEIIKDSKFAKDTIKDLITFNGKENFLFIIKENLQEKKLVFIRHAQAEHNEYNIYHKPKGIKQPDFYDPNITSEGILQCENIKEFLKNLNFKVNIVFISPLRRTLQTFDKIKEHFTESKFIVTELLREKVKNPNTHFGHSISDLRKIFKELDLDYDYLLKEYWWSLEKDEDYDHKNFSENFIKEDIRQFEIRILLQLIWFIFREEKNGCLISHSKVYSSIHKNNKKAKHGGQYVLESEDLLNFISDLISNLEF